MDTKSPTNMQKYLAVLANEAALAAQELGGDSESRVANLAVNLNVLARFPEEADDYCDSEEWDEAPEDVLDGQCTEFAEMVPGGKLLTLGDLERPARKARALLKEAAKREFAKRIEAREAANRG